MSNTKKKHLRQLKKNLKPKPKKVPSPTKPIKKKQISLSEDDKPKKTKPLVKKITNQPKALPKALLTPRKKVGQAVQKPACSFGLKCHWLFPINGKPCRNGSHDADQKNVTKFFEKDDWEEVLQHAHQLDEQGDPVCPYKKKCYYLFTKGQCNHALDLGEIKALYDNYQSSLQTDVSEEDEYADEEQ